MKRNATTRGSLIAGMLLALGAVNCDGLHADLCEQAAQCGGGGEPEIDACIADLDRREEIAAIYGCEDLWDDYLACLETYGYCDEHGNLSGCDGPDESYRHCVDVGERGKAKVEYEPAPGTLEPAAFGPQGELDEDVPKPKKSKCSVAEPGAGAAGPAASYSWLLVSLLGLALLRQRRRG